MASACAQWARTEGGTPWRECRNDVGRVVRGVPDRAGGQFRPPRPADPRRAARGARSTERGAGAVLRGMEPGRPGCDPRLTAGGISCAAISFVVHSSPAAPRTRLRRPRRPVSGRTSLDSGPRRRRLAAPVALARHDRVGAVRGWCRLRRVPGHRASADTAAAEIGRLPGAGPGLARPAAGGRSDRNDLLRVDGRRVVRIGCPGRQRRTSCGCAHRGVRCVHHGADQRRPRLRGDPVTLLPPTTAGESSGMASGLSPMTSGLFATHNREASFVAAPIVEDVND